MKRFTRACVLAALCAAIALFPSRVLAQGPGDAHIGVVAIANGAPAGAGHQSAIVITAAPEGATLQHVTVQVRDGRQQVVNVIQADGHGQSQVAITAPAVFQNQQLRVHAQVHPPTAPGASVVNVFADAAVASSSAQATVDVSGGTVSVPGGGTIEIPQGALDSETTIEVRVSTQAGPAGVTPLSPVYEFLPEGLLFARPVTVTLPVPAGVTSASVYWSRLGAPGYDAIGGAVSGDTITAQTVHFSSGMVGQASSTRTVTGVGQTTWISASTRVSEPVDFSTQGVEALITDANGNVTAVYPGTGGLGTFTIPGVPDGEYILHSGAQYIVTTSNTPDLGTLRGGRPISQRTAVTQNTFLTINASNLAPWQKNAQQEDLDQLEFFSTEANDWDFDLEGRFAFPAAGDTATTVNINLLHILGTSDPPSEIHGSSGDVAFLAQLSAAASPTVTYQAMSRVALLPSFDLASGGTVTVSGPMADVSQSNTFSADYRGSQFLSESLQGNPNRTGEINAFIGVLGQPGSSADGFYSSNADLLLMSNNGTDVVTGPMTYGTPADAGLAGNWGVLFDTRFVSFINLPPLPGTTGFRAPARPREAIDWTTTADAAQAAPITPPVSMPTGVTVNGIDYYQGGSGIGMTPTFSWSPGAIGQPSFYKLVVVRLTAGPDNKTGLQIVAQILTPNTTLRLPPGILQSGQTYVFRLYSVVSTSVAGATLLATSPFKNGLDIGFAMTVSGEFHP